MAAVMKDAGDAVRHQTFLRVKRAGSGFSFTGWASTADLDLVGDSVDPAGAVYELPLPLLWMHDHAQPVGVVESAHLSGKGIRVSFRLLGEVEKTREAVALIEAGALALSIGFLPLEAEPLPNGGTRYRRWRWNELSIVSVACNPAARIDRVGKCLVVPIEPKAAPVRAPAAVRRGKFPPDDGQALVAFGKGIGGVIREALQPLKARIGALEAAAENSAAMKFRGFWSGGTFARGDVVIHDAGLWIAISETETTPSRGAAGWALLATK